MAKKNLNKSNFSDNTWKKLAPKSSRKPASTAAFKKRLVLISKFFALALILISVGLISWFLNHKSNFGPIDLTGPSMPVSGIEFQSDGSLNKKWFNNWFGPLRNRTLMDLDIAMIQAELMLEPQIIFARVSREFPSKLLVNITERKPILRLCLRSKSTGEEIWLVSKEGNIYKGQCYGRSSLQHLPYLDLKASTLKFTSNKKGFEPLDDISVVAPLLEVAKNKFPSFYTDWQIVSYNRPNDNDPGAYIKIKSRKIENLRFAPHSYEKQLKKLKYLFSEPKFYQSETIERIDLSHDRSVFAKII